MAAAASQFPLRLCARLLKARFVGNVNVLAIIAMVVSYGN